MGLTSSHHFLSIHVTLNHTGRPSRILPNRFLCIGFHCGYNVAICIYTLTMLNQLQERALSPVTYTVLCVRFTSVVLVCRSRNRWRRSVRGATLDTGGWLSLQKSVT